MTVTVFAFLYFDLARNIISFKKFILNYIEKCTYNRGKIGERQSQLKKPTIKSYKIEKNTRFRLASTIKLQAISDERSPHRLPHRLPFPLCFGLDVRVGFCSGAVFCSGTGSFCPAAFCPDCFCAAVDLDVSVLVSG